MCLSAKRPSTDKPHYRGRQLALWLDLIPKINKADGTSIDPVHHQLNDFNNMSTFDDPERLVNPFAGIFPSPPPMPPITPPHTDRGDVSTQETSRDFTMEEADHSASPIIGSSKDVSSVVQKDDSTTPTSPVAEQVQDTNIAHSSVPLSITVAIGCSLLFLNVLILAGVYYQRERIRKMRLGDQGQEEILRDSHNPTGPEGSSLMGVGQHLSEKPTPSKVINTQLELQNNPIYTPISKNSQAPSVTCNYTPLSTKSSSPMHKNQVTSNSHPPGKPPLNGRGPIGGPSNKWVERPSGQEPIGRSSKFNHISTSKDTPTSNNAITIV